MEEAITGSDMQWTIARPPRLVDGRDEEYQADDAGLPGGLTLGTAMS